MTHRVSGSRSVDLRHLRVTHPQTARIAALVEAEAIAGGTGAADGVLTEAEHRAGASALSDRAATFASLFGDIRPALAHLDEAVSAPGLVKPEDAVSLENVPGFKTPAGFIVSGGTVRLLIDIESATGSPRIHRLAIETDDGRSFARARIVEAPPRRKKGLPHRRLTRLDGGHDVYYAAEGPEGRGLSIFRRPHFWDGTVGPQERLTGVDFGSVSKPQVARLADGAALLSFSVGRGVEQGVPRGEQRMAVRLEADAPASTEA